MKYILKKLTVYLVSVSVMMLVYGIVAVGLFVRMGEFANNLIMAVIMFAYPIFCILRSTIDITMRYLDGAAGSGDGVFAGLFYALMPEVLDGRPQRILVLNLASKLLQLIVIGTMMYAFISNEFDSLRVIAVLFVIIAIVFAVLFARRQLAEYKKRHAAQLAKMDEIRGESGMHIDRAKRAGFMKQPRTILLANIILAVAGLALVSADPHMHHAFSFYFVGIVKYLGSTSVLLLPFSAVYLWFELNRGEMYTLRLGRGDYGQAKIEFFTYTGSGDEMTDTRHIIDRVDEFETGSRYIRVLMAGNVRRVAIPRTMSPAAEKKLTAALREMTDHGRMDAIFRKLEEEKARRDPV